MLTFNLPYLMNFVILLLPMYSQFLSLILLSLWFWGNASMLSLCKSGHSLNLAKQNASNIHQPRGNKCSLSSKSKNLKWLQDQPRGWLSLCSAWLHICLWNMECWNKQCWTEISLSKSRKYQLHKLWAQTRYLSVLHYSLLSPSNV